MKEVTEEDDGHILEIVDRGNWRFRAKNEITFPLVDFMGKYDFT